MASFQAHPHGQARSDVTYPCSRPEWNNKAAAIVSYGSSGGLMAASALRETLSTLQVAVVSQQPSFSLFTDFENMAVFAPSPVHENSVVGMLGQVEKWATALEGTRLAA